MYQGSICGRENRERTILGLVYELLTHAPCVNAGAPWKGASLVEPSARLGKLLPDFSDRFPQQQQSLLDDARAMLSGATRTIPKRDRFEKPGSRDDGKSGFPIFSTADGSLPSEVL